MHLAADLCAQAVDDLVQGLRAGGVHVDEELVLGLVCARRAGLDVGEVDALFLKGGKMETRRPDWVTAFYSTHAMKPLPVAAGMQQCARCTTRG